MLRRRERPAVVATVASRRAKFSAHERIELIDALAAFTAGTAWVNHLERELGSLEVGKTGDFVVLDRDLFDRSPGGVRPPAWTHDDVDSASDVDVRRSLAAGCSPCASEASRRKERPVNVLSIFIANEHSQAPMERSVERAVAHSVAGPSLRDRIASAAAALRRLVGGPVASAGVLPKLEDYPYRS